jgi:hypothetical protein
MKIEIQGHMNTPKWVFSTLPVGPYEKFHPKNHLPFYEFFGHGKRFACGKNPTRISLCHETITKK